MNMKSLLRRLAVVPILAMAVLGFASGTADAAPAAYTCAGGPVPAGTYASLSITGDCYIKDAAVTVNGNVSVGPTSAAKLFAYPVPTARLTVKGSLSADGAGDVSLGCYRASLCGGSTTVTVAGSMAVSRTSRLQLDYVAVGGNLTVTGTASTCDDPRSSIQIYDSAIGGNLSVTGNTTCLVQVGGNTIKGSLACTGNTPAITLTGPNVVKGRTTGQCLAPANGS